MSPVDREHLSQQPPEDEAPDALDGLLGELRVEVRSGFSTQVMARLPEPPWRAHRSASREWMVAAALVVLLVLIAAFLLSDGGRAGDGVATSIVDLMVATLAAGAGFLAASWAGLGAAVDAAIGGSVTALVALGLAALATNGLLVLLIRRRRAAARARDDS